MPDDHGMNSSLATQAETKVTLVRIGVIVSVNTFSISVNTESFELLPKQRCEAVGVRSVRAIRSPGTRIDAPISYFESKRNCYGISGRDVKQALRIKSLKADIKRTRVKHLLRNCHA